MDLTVPRKAYSLVLTLMAGLDRAGVMESLAISTSHREDNTNGECQGLDI